MRTLPDLPASTGDLPNRSQASPPSGRELAVFTLALWLACTLVSTLGFVLPYARPRPPAPPEEPVLVQQLQVELKQEPVPPDSTPLLTPEDVLNPPPMPQPIVVAQPTPAIAFALPVEGLVRVVDAKRADYGRPVVTNAPLAAQPLTFGEGEGKQPAPDYPRQSVRQGQEGVVGVRFVVDEAGRVQSAEATSPSPWPLLNDAAVRAVREHWRFRNGAPRLFEVSIRFALTK